MHKIKISTLVTAGPKCKSCYSEKKKEKKSSVFLYSQKTDKDEFNTILKHLIKLVKNFKPTVIFFLNISHLSFFFFFNSPVQVVSGLMGVRVGFQVGAVLSDRDEEELRGEVSICDLYSPVTS